jgi:hypothetical protein
MPATIKQCASKLAILLIKHKVSRATISAEYFREITGRNRIEDAFLKQLLAYCLENKTFVVQKISPEKYLIARTTDRYLPGDPGAPSPDEKDE